MGFLVPAAPWSARIAGVASKAVILLADDGAAISIVGRIEDLDARAFVIAAGFQEFQAAASAALAEHGEQASVRYDDSNLSFDGTKKNVASASATLVWDPRGDLKKAAERLDGSMLVAVRMYIEDELRSAHESGRSHEGIHGDGPFAAAFARLQAASTFPANLVGFGPGSTPAGDDWLSGYLTGRDLMEGGPGTAEPVLRSAVEAALCRTTASGRALLIGALAGAPPLYLVELALATTGIDRKANVRAAVRVALEHGATSGEDAIAGFIQALRSSP
ncbi:MAG: hypothetical protein A2Y38_26245 [Spirochaetes bacterium GWB1_59_5]|nr:MAG: hypothetical protein A2Y38_26245 [Spirochaetes bacterium GWB1_59_5]